MPVVEVEQPKVERHSAKHPRSSSVTCPVAFVSQSISTTERLSNNREFTKHLGVNIQFSELRKKKLEVTRKQS